MLGAANAKERRLEMERIRGTCRRCLLEERVVLGEHSSSSTLVPSFNIDHIHIRYSH